MSNLESFCKLGMACKSSIVGVSEQAKEQWLQYTSDSIQTEHIINYCAASNLPIAGW